MTATKQGRKRWRKRKAKAMWEKIQYCGNCNGRVKTWRRIEGSRWESFYQVWRCFCLRCGRVYKLRHNKIDFARLHVERYV